MACGYNSYHDIMLLLQALHLCCHVAFLMILILLQVGPVLEAMEDILAALLRSLDGRVYVAVGRGLWDFTSKDIYDYVDSLQEGKENKVCGNYCTSDAEGDRQAAASVNVTLLGTLHVQALQLLMLSLAAVLQSLQTACKAPDCLLCCHQQTIKYLLLAGGMARQAECGCCPQCCRQFLHCSTQRHIAA